MTDNGRLRRDAGSRPTPEDERLTMFFASLERASYGAGRAPGLRHAAGQLPFVPASPSTSSELSSPEVDDSAELICSNGVRRLAESWMASIPSGVNVLQRDVFMAILSDEPWAGDPRWKELYGSQLFVSYVLWSGARQLLDAGTDEPPISQKYPLEELVPLLEKRFEKLLRSELSRFWTEAAPGGGAMGRVGSSGSLASHGASSMKGGHSAATNVRHLHNMPNMALQFTLALASIAFRIQIARPDGSSACISQLVAIWRRARLPCEQAFRPPILGLDDFLMNEHWLAAFWMTLANEFLLAPSSARPLLFDPVKEFPSIPMSISSTALEMVNGAVLSAGSAWNQPLSPKLAAELETQSRFVCSDVLGWMDPMPESSSVDPATRDAVLQRFVSTFQHGGPLQYAVIFSYGFLRVSEYVKWLKEEVKLGPLDILIAGELIALGTTTQKASTNLPKEYLESLMTNPLLPEAARRSEFLRDAIARTEASLPESLAAAFYDGDFVGLMTQLAPLPGDGAAQVIGMMTTNRLVALLLVSPEPFVDLAKEESEGDLLLEAWFSLPSFFEASRNAIIISTIMRMFVAHVPKKELETNKLLAFTCCFSASYAAWFHLLVLRRFRSMVSTATATELTRAVELHEEIRRDVEACLNIIELTNHPDYLPVRATLRAVLDGDAASLSEEDLRMLKLTQRATRFCGHQNGKEDRDGICFACLAERNEMGESSSRVADPLAELPVYGVKERKVVSFSDEIEEGETYSSVEYARARLLETAETDEVPAIRSNGDEDEAIRRRNALTGLIQQRDSGRKLPNLREFG